MMAKDDLKLQYIQITNQDWDAADALLEESEWDIETAISRFFDPLVQSAREARKIRDKQDSDYERSLAQDREKTQRRREEASAAAEAEQSASNKNELRERWRMSRAGRLEPEPDAGARGSVRIALKMREPNGGRRIVRRFRGSAPMEELYAFAECHDVPQEAREGVEKPEGYVHKYDFAIASVMPRKVHAADKKSIINVIGSSESLIVEDLSEDYVIPFWDGE